MEYPNESELKIIRKFNERLLNCFLDKVILNQIEKQALSGYDLITYIFKSYGILLSPGTVYATLYSLERDGLVRSSSRGRKKVFSLTERGKKTLEVVRNSIDLKNFLMKLIHDEIKTAISLSIS